MIKKYLAILSISILFTACNHPDPIRIGLVLSTENDTVLAETNGAIQFLEKLSEPQLPLSKWRWGREMKSIKSEMIQIKDLISRKSLSGFDILWFHLPDSLQTAAVASDPEALKKIRSFVDQGGKLLLTLEAVNLLNDLGIEDTPVESQQVALIDEGYGRKAGLHSFRGHPLFSGLNGGAFIFNPARDTVCRVNGFFGANIPAHGKVIAVDWAYIFLREENKLVVEYDHGQGKVLGIGAYTYFSPENTNRAHLELFMQNAFNYLSLVPADETTFFWNYAHRQVTKIEKASKPIPVPESKKWNVSGSDIAIPLDSASNDFWDLASPRLVVMGKEAGGIEEIWAHPFMAFRDYEAGIRLLPGDSVTWLSTLEPRMVIDPAFVKRTYALGDARLDEVITVDPEDPVGVVHYEWTGLHSAELFIRCTSNLRLMWPYSEKVIHEMQYGWDEGLEAMIITDGSGQYTALMGSNKEPSQVHAGQYDTINAREKGFISSPTDEFQVRWMVSYPLGTRDFADILIAASDEGKEQTLASYHRALKAPDAVYLRNSNHIHELFAQHLMITTPDEAFNRGYRWALVGTDRFFVNTPGIGGSLVAGYGTTARGWDGEHRINGRPGYAWYFGRDGQWSGMALLDYGDFEKVRSILEVYQKFQDLNGKIYHELTTSGVVHYDAADATPLYIILAGKYLHHSGDTAFIRQSWPNIQKAIDFCFSTDTDADHLIENTNVGHGWVEGGNLYGSHTSLYLASCWAEALNEAAYMAEQLGFERNANDYAAESVLVTQIINRDFWNPNTGFYHQGKFRDGSYLSEATILSAIPVYFGQTGEEKGASIVSALAGNGFTADWGVRIVSQESPLFHPRAYHAGTVWPLFTGWAAMAEYRQGVAVQGYTHIMNNMLIKNHWAKGFIEEVLHGLQYKPSGVCAHQCWSETMVLQPAIEGMLGLEVSAPEHSLELSPQFPFDWDSVTVSNIRIEDQVIGMVFQRKGNTLNYRFTKDGSQPVKVGFSPLLPPGTEILATTLNGQEMAPAIHEQDQGIRLLTSFDLADTCLITVSFNKGISILPCIPHPEPGDTSEGFRIISSRLMNDQYHIMMEGPAGKKGVFHLYAADDQEIVKSSPYFFEKIPHGYQIEINFEASERPFVTKEVVLELK